MAGIKIVDLPAVGRDLAATDLFEMSLVGGTGSRKITGQEIMNASKLSVNNTPVINGTSGRIFFQGSTNVLQQSANLFWDATNNRLGIGTETPSYNLDVVSASSPNFRITRTGATEIRIGASTLAGGGIIGTYSASTLNFLTNGTESFRIFTTQNIGINTTTDAGFRLDVNGPARVTELTVGSLGTNALISLGGGVNTTIFRDVSDVSLNYRNVFSATVVHRFRTNSDLPNANTSGNNVFLSLPIGFAPTSGTGTWAQLSMTPTINQTGGANGITRGLFVNPTLTAAADFRAIETTAGNVLFGTGFFWDNTNGRLGIGNNSPSFPVDILGSLVGNSFGIKIRNSASNGYTEINCYNNAGSPFDRMYMGVGGTTTGDAFQNRGYFLASFNLEGVNFTATKPTTGDIRFFTGGVNERLRIHGSGNIGINTTTDAGFRLDVNGTARLSNSEFSALGVRIQTTSFGVGGITLNGSPITPNQLAVSPGFLVNQTSSVNLTSGGAINLVSAVIQSTSGNVSIVNTSSQFGFTSGNASGNALSLVPFINTSGTYSGIIRGLYYAPTFGTTVGVTHYAIHTTIGRIRFEGLPTSPTGLSAGDLWNNGGVINIV
jgi:hypothetical protein